MSDDDKTILRGGNKLTSWLLEGAESRGLKRTNVHEVDVPPFLRGRGITKGMLYDEKHRGKVRRASADTLGFRLSDWEEHVGCHCAGEIIPGALCPFNEFMADDGQVIVQKCDQCGRFEDDEHAAEALANYLDIGWGIGNGTAFLLAEDREIRVIKHLIQGIRQVAAPEAAIERALPHARPEYTALKEVEKQLEDSLALVRQLMEDPNDR
jgi:hypothetical protein